MHIHTLAKSCNACIRSKKKCDKRSPCRRCSARGVQCRYQNEPLTILLSQPTPLKVRAPAVPKSPCPRANKTRHSRAQECQIFVRNSLTCQQLTEPEMLFPLELDSFISMIESFQASPVMAAEDGGNPMIHHLLYHIIDPPGTVLATNNLVRQNLRQLNNHQHLPCNTLEPVFETLLSPSLPSSPSLRFSASYNPSSPCKSSLFSPAPPPWLPRNKPPLNTASTS